MTGRPADALLKDMRGSREGTMQDLKAPSLCRPGTLSWSPAESGARVAADVRMQAAC